MVLVWLRSTVPLVGSMVKPLCCREAMLSRPNSMLCGAVGFRGQWGWGGGGPAPSDLAAPAMRLPAPTYHRAGPGGSPAAQAWRGSVLVTFFWVSWVVRMQPTCSSRVAGGAGVSASS